MIKHKRQILQTIEHQKKTLLLESDIDNRIDIKRNIEHERTKLKKTLLLNSNQEWLDKIIIDGKFKFKYFITIKYKFNDSNTIEKTESAFKRFKNIFLCSAYQESKITKVPKDRIRIIAFNEIGEDGNYHTHFICESINALPTKESILILLQLTQSRCRHVENGRSAVHVTEYNEYHKHYSSKQNGLDYLSLDIYNSDIK